MVYPPWNYLSGPGASGHLPCVLLPSTPSFLPQSDSDMGQLSQLKYTLELKIKSDLFATGKLDFMVV